MFYLSPLGLCHGEIFQMSDFDLIIFGGLGDLSRKKLLPALFSGFVAGHVAEDCRIILTGRSAPQESTHEWLKSVLETNEPACGMDEKALKKFANIVHISQLPLNKDSDEWSTIAGLLSDSGRPLIHFLAIPPAIFSSTCALIGQHGLNGKNACVVLEKPIGHNRATAAEINDQVALHFTEEQTFRIDHYLGKEAVQNLLALRFSNILFEQLWNAKTIDHIQISIAEDLGVEGRGGFYEGTGALKDMVQNHLLQLLCFIAMEPPAKLDAGGIREEKLKVLKSLKPLLGGDIDANVVRGQYVGGKIKGQSVGSYTNDLQIAHSETDSFIAIKANIENWRWAGVPFYLRTGKRLPDRFAEIVIQFKNVPHAANPDWHGGMQPNRFIIRLQPEDHLALRMMVKDGDGSRADLREVELKLDGARDDGSRLGPYLRLILDAARGDQSLFVHRDEVDMAWSWIDRITEHWAETNAPLVFYPAGNWGPKEAEELMTRDGRKWYDNHSGRT